MKERRKPGVVVKSVITSACHAEGRGFESRPPRKAEDRELLGFFFLRDLQCAPEKRTSGRDVWVSRAREAFLGCGEARSAPLSPAIEGRPALCLTRMAWRDIACTCHRAPVRSAPPLAARAACSQRSWRSWTRPTSADQCGGACVDLGNGRTCDSAEMRLQLGFTGDRRSGHIHGHSDAGGLLNSSNKHPAKRALAILSDTQKY